MLKPLESGKLDFIQALRAIAVVMVVLCHARFFFRGSPYEELTEWLLAPGGAGVDIFFLISGFVMVYSTRNSPGTFRYTYEFIVKRFAKIWTPYAVIGLIFYTIKNSESIFTTNSLIWVTKSLAFIPPDISQPFYYGGGLIPVAWSLNYEFYFYLIFGTSLLFKSWRLPFLIAWIAATTYLVPVMNRGFFSVLPMSKIETSSTYVQMITNPIILEFLAGMLIGRLYLSLPRIESVIYTRAFVGISIGVCGVAWITNYRNLNSITYYGAFASLLLISMSIADKCRKIKVPKLLLWIGTRSYSLYLVHVPVNKLAIYLATAIGMPELLWNPVIVAVILMISFILANCSYHLLEISAHDKLRDLLLSGFRDQKPVTITDHG
jgi:hypothetical protein